MISPGNARTRVHSGSIYGRVVCLADTIEVPYREAKDRRRDTRFRPGDVHWLHGARLNYGPEVHIVNLSANGILIENECELPRDANIVFEFLGTTGIVRVPARVLRSRRFTSGDLEWYETACRFKRPVEFQGLVAEVGGRGKADVSIIDVDHPVHLATRIARALRLPRRAFAGNRTK